MENEDRQLMIENLAAMRELRGEMREFKEHVMGRVERLEKLESEQGRKTAALISLFISSAALAVSIIANFLKHGGK